VVTEPSPTTEGTLVTYRLSARAFSLAAVAVLAGMATAVPSAADAQQVSPSSASISAHRLAPTYLRGQVVNQDTGTPVAGVRVTLRDVVSLDVLATDRTDRNGRFRMDGLFEDEYAVKFAGGMVGYETGFLGCGHGVVPTWGEACSFGTGPIGKARLEKL